jgi:hydroxymethylbilane synthase
MDEVVRIGTRGSQLALWQAHWVQGQLKQLNIESALKIIETSGDKFLAENEAGFPAQGIFVKEIEDQLLNKEIDLAIHSAKDLPTTVPQGLTLAAFSKRENPKDVIVFNSQKFKVVPELINQVPLPIGAKVATGSVRRSSQLLALRPDLEVEPIRGNVATRLKKMEEKFDAIILAAAGLKRLDLLKNYLHYEIPAGVMIPAVGQGVLALECRESDSVLRKILEKINNSESEKIILAERHFLHALQGGCRAPIACHGAIDEKNIFTLSAAIGLPNGSVLIKKERSGKLENAFAVANDLVSDFISAGVTKILREAREKEARS